MATVVLIIIIVVASGVLLAAIVINALFSFVRSVEVQNENPSQPRACRSEMCESTRPRKPRGTKQHIDPEVPTRAGLI